MISKSEIKAIKRLKLKKYRIKDELFLVEGVKNIKELLTSDLEMVSLHCLHEHSVTFRNVPHSEISDAQLQSITSFVTHQGCLAVARIPKAVTLQHGDNDKHTILLDGVSDPGNLGTIVRTLDWFGYTRLICSLDCADFYNPKTISATMGSFTRVKVEYTDLVGFIKEYEGDVYAMALNGQPIESFDATLSASIFVLGSESHGIRPELLSLIEKHITISKYGKAESLNVGIAAGILLHKLSLA